MLITKLSPNFKLEELTRSQTATRHSIDNTPDAASLVQLVYLCITLQKVRKLVGLPLYISSGYRCEELNTHIGGSKYSDHMIGRAADFTVPGLTTTQLFNLIKESDINYSTLILEFPDDPGGGWIHLSNPEFNIPRARKNLIATKENNITKYEYV